MYNPIIRTFAALFLALITTPLLAAEDRWISDFNITRESIDNPMVLIDTSAGEIVVELFPSEAPQTVANFIGLAEGTKPFTDPFADEPVQVTRPFYDGLIFHRVIDDFMIQSGSPTGLGDGEPGYVIPDEINARHLGLDKMTAMDEDGLPHPYLGINTETDFRRTILLPLYQEMGIESNQDVQARAEEVYDALDNMTVMEVNQRLGYQYNERYPSRMPLAGVIAMANSGPNTNGSQFFITMSDAPWLTGKFTVFGKVRVGMDVVELIGNTRTDANDRPIQNVTIHSIRQLKE